MSLKRLLALGRRKAGELRRRTLLRLARGSNRVQPGTVALTYDDGPDPSVTPVLLDLLRDGGVRATFFLVGEKAQRFPDLVRRIVEDGHAVGTHTMHHLDLRTVSRATGKRDIEDGRAVLEQIIGGPVRLFRPPKGHLTVGVSWFLRSKRWETWLWSADTYDWKEGLAANEVMEAACTVNDGGVLLLHDSRERCLDATRALIPNLADRRLEAIRL